MIRVKKALLGIGGLVLTIACAGIGIPSAPTPTPATVTVEESPQKIHWETETNKIVSTLPELPFIEDLAEIAVDEAGNAYAIWNGFPDQKAGIYFAYRPAGGAWEGQVRLDDPREREDVFFPDIAVDSRGNAYAVWFSVDKPDAAVYFASRPAGGKWGANLLLSHGDGEWKPRVAVDGAGTVSVVWTDSRDGDAETYFTARPAGGEWEPETRVGEVPLSGDQSDPSLVADAAGNLYLAWLDKSEQSGGVYFTWRPVGKPWQAAERVAPFEHPAEWPPELAVDAAGTVYLVWEEFTETLAEINFAYRRDGRWSVERAVNTALKLEKAHFPALAVDPAGTVSILMTLERTLYNSGEPVVRTLIYSIRRPVGKAWETTGPVNDNKDGVGEMQRPDLAIDGAGNLYALWSDDRGIIPDIYFSFNPEGRHWGSNQRVSVDPEVPRQREPALVVDGRGTAYALWKDSRNGNADIYFSYSRKGKAWTSGVRVNDDSGTADQVRPALAIDGQGNLYALWEDGREGRRNIYFSWRPVDGEWQPNVRLEASSEGGRGQPVLKVDAAGNAYALWLKFSSQAPHSEIYFSYRPAGGEWQPEAKVRGPSERDVDEMALAVSRTGGVCAAWQEYPDQSSSNILASCRPAEGSWDSPVQIMEGDTEQLLSDFTMEMDGAGNAYLLWQVTYPRENSKSELYLASRSAAGPWDAGTVIGSFKVQVFSPVMDMDQRGNLCVALVQPERVQKKVNITLTCRSAGGEWVRGDPINDKVHPLLKTGVALALDELGNVHVLWDENVATDTGFGWAVLTSAFLPEVFTNP